MKQTLKNWFAALLLAVPMSAAVASGGHANYEKVDIDLRDQVSLQHGAQIFTNYCLSCHSASGMRFNRLKDIGLTEDEIKKKQAELTRYKINAQETEVYRFLLEKANRVYSMLLGRRRDELMAETRSFEEEVRQASMYHLPKLYQSFSNYLEFLERGL